MKFQLGFIACMALAMASCAGNSGDKKGDSALTKSDTALANAPDAPPVNMEYCFYTTDGTTAQDTTEVNLRINGNDVTGDMNWLPKEKDARRGSLTGKLNDNVIKALWTYNQEGSKDTLSVEFQLRGNQLAQKPYKYDTQTGKPQTDNAAGYNVIYNMKNCK
ncbi:hypothetical protein LX99_01131 [Mucilaginibacter oryzae]|uniref:Lipoprotein n=1 Tax=Mucilaginibacter oryzae TaxID=468058 RepID=A0A316HET9_9SPHI|nr:hypothetical protein [Mucilaginibacter oryzae]PWK78683.1 hypothetical protein LX99_01131 [Mucilaginibacter oryzae]